MQPQSEQNQAPEPQLNRNESIQEVSSADIVAGESQQPGSPWTYNASESAFEQMSTPHVSSVEWTASEYIHHEKPAVWFAILTLIAAGLAALTYVITNETIAVGLVIVVAVLFGIMAARKPQTLQYRLDSASLTIGSNVYSYNRFKSFSIIEEGALHFIQLMPLGRVSPPISIYFPPDQEEEIINMISNYLPHEPRDRDMVDRLMSKIRF